MRKVDIYINLIQDPKPGEAKPVEYPIIGEGEE